MVEKDKSTMTFKIPVQASGATARIGGTDALGVTKTEASPDGGLMVTIACDPKAPLHSDFELTVDSADKVVIGEGRIDFDPEPAMADDVPVGIPDDDAEEPESTADDSPFIESENSMWDDTPAEIVKSTEVIDLGLVDAGVKKSYQVMIDVKDAVARIEGNDNVRVHKIEEAIGGGVMVTVAIDRAAADSRFSLVVDSPHKTVTGEGRVKPPRMVESADLAAKKGKSRLSYKLVTPGKSMIVSSLSGPVMPAGIGSYRGQLGVASGLTFTPDYTNVAQSASGPQIAVPLGAERGSRPIHSTLEMQAVCGGSVSMKVPVPEPLAVNQSFTAFFEPKMKEYWLSQSKGTIPAGAKEFPFSIYFAPRDVHPTETLLVVQCGDVEMCVKICGSTGGFEGRRWGERRAESAAVHPHSDPI
jgi:hypothetical protein